MKDEKELRAGEAIKKRNKLIKALEEICEDNSKEMHEVIGWAVLSYYEDLFEKGNLLDYKRSAARKMDKIDLLKELVQYINFKINS
jgi:hypothetical protein